MAFAHEDEQDLLRRYSPHWAIITNNVDPKGRGDVEVKAPGVFGKGRRWCAAAGVPGAGGSDQTGRGFHKVPPIGAQVIIMAVQGDLEELIYFSGPHTPTTKLKGLEGTTGAQAAAIDTWETDNLRITFTDVDDQQLIYLGDKKGKTYIKLDVANGIIEIKAANQLNNRGKKVSSKGLIVALQGRNVSKFGDPVV
jgi:hypothetical protein